MEGCEASVNARCPHSLTHHLHLHLPTTFASVTRPLPIAHCPAGARPGKGGEGFHRSSPSPGLHPVRCSPAPLLPSCSRAPHAVVLALTTLSSLLPPALLSRSSLLEPRAGLDTFWPLHKGSGTAPGTLDYVGVVPFLFHLQLTCRSRSVGRVAGSASPPNRGGRRRHEGTHEATHSIRGSVADAQKQRQRTPEPGEEHWHHGTGHRATPAGGGK